MTAFMNTSVNNNTAIQSNWRIQEQPKFDIGMAPKPDLDAGKPEATVSNFAGLVPSNSNLETKKFDTAALATTSFQSEPVVAEQAAPEASAATGEGKTVDLNWHSAAPFTMGFPATPYVHNSWNRPPAFTPPAPWSPPKPWSPTTPVGNAWNPNPVANPTPWAGIPNSVAHKPFAHTAEVAGTLQQQNWGNPNITSGHVANQFNLNQNQAVTVNRLASGNGNTWDQNPTATAGQLNNLLGNGWTTPGQMQNTILKAADTASFNHRANPATGGITFDGYQELTRNAGQGNGTYQSFANIAGTNWWEGMPHSISPGELQARGLSFDHNGHFSVSQFADIARRAQFG